MVQLLAIIGLITVAVLMWKAFGPQPRVPSNRAVQGPDDDPEFLWRLQRKLKDNDPDEP